jgi:cyclohexanone monooxygenase
MAAQKEPVFDIIVVGAGFAGLYLLYRLRTLGFRTLVIEAADGVGGTWYWNRYPGARCDVESMAYSYSFSESLEQDWVWTERYAAQPEILAYANHVSDRFGLREDICFNTWVARAVFSETDGLWTLTSDEGLSFGARFVIMALGCLSAPHRPDIPGISEFAGECYHTGYWPHQKVDFSGKTVGVIGTGSSAVQAIPLIAKQAAHLSVFQRSPNFSIPAWNGPLDEESQRHWKNNYRTLRAEARQTSSGILNMDSDHCAAELSPDEQHNELERRWQHGGLIMWNAFNDIMTDPASNELAASFVRRKICEKVKDRKIADLLCPKDHPLGSKRLCVDTDYYETFNRKNVTLVDIRSHPIEKITAQGVQTSHDSYALDVIVLATGFDAMTGPMMKIDIRGRDGVSIERKWSDGPRTYLGIAIADFPNLFMVTGPGSPSVLSNVLLAIEQHVDWISDCLCHMRSTGFDIIEASPQAEDDWVIHVNDVANPTLYTHSDSWYMGANIPGKPRVFMPYVGGAANYRELCNEVSDQGYTGFTMSKSAATAPRNTVVSANEQQRIDSQTFSQPRRNSTS